METIKAAASALGAIKLDAYRERYAVTDAELAKVRAARQEGIDQRSEVIREIARRRTRELDATRAADALVDGTDVLDALESEETLAERRDALSAAVGELNRREEELSNGDRRRIYDDLIAELSPAVDPVVQELEERARAAISELLAVRADAEALRAATRNANASLLVSGLQGPDPATFTERLAIRFRLTMPEKVPPSPAVASLLRNHAELIQLAGNRLPRG